MEKSGEKLRKVLDFTGITQVELSERLGVKTSQLSHWIMNRRVPSYMYVSKIIEALNIPAAWLFNEEPKEGGDKISRLISYLEERKKVREDIIMFHNMEIQKHVRDLEEIK